LNNKIEELYETRNSQKYVTQRKITDRKIEKFVEQRKALQEIKSEFMVHTAEYLANEDQVIYMIMKTVLDINGNQIWPGVDDLFAFRNKHPMVITFLATEIIGGNPVNIKDIRALARAPEWRLLWGLSKKDLGSLFKTDITSLNTNQRVLIYWSRVYDSVYEDPNRPPDNVIEDDDELDEWLENREQDQDRSYNKQNPLDSVSQHAEVGVVLDGYYSEQCNCGVKKIKAKGHGERPRHAQNCPYGVYIQYTPEEKEAIANQIYGRNAPGTRKYMAKEQDKVESDRIVEEQKLRDKRSFMWLGYDPVRRK
jgi:hypothetical protein